MLGQGMVGVGCLPEQGSQHTIHFNLRRGLLTLSTRNRPDGYPTRSLSSGEIS